ncbi:zinc finger and BTB domain-containing protein 49 isoform X2 [Ambystoma mexicanum]
MYTSHLDLNQDNVQAMLDIAQCLQVHIVLNMCHTFLKPHTPVETSGTSSLNAFPLLGSSLVDSDYVVNETPSTHSQHSLQSGPTKALIQSNKHLGNQHLEGTHYDKLHDTSGYPEKQLSDTPVTELPSHHYKLRNFFSKQNKQNLNAKQDSKEGHLVQPKEYAEPLHTDSLVLSETLPQNVSESANTVPSNLLGGSSNKCPTSPDPGSTSLLCTRVMRLKKAVHLKKLNFLRSQTSVAMLPSESETDDCGIKDAFTTITVLPIDDHSDKPNKDKETEHPFAFNSSEHLDEREQCQSISELEDHPQTTQSQKHYPCDLCGKNFKHPSNLELHRRSHTGEKPFECVICGKRFSQAGNLQTHLRRHSGEKPYICEICGKRFAASGDVQRHIVIHTGEKPHLCDTCGRGFSNFSNLTEHKKTHATDKVFVCDECGKSFNMHQKLVKHGIRHKGERPYICSTCGKRFGGSGDLRRHMRTHTGEKPYTCETCNKCFSRPAVLRRHKRTHWKTSDEISPVTIEDFSQAVESSDPERSQSGDSFTHDISAPLLPVLVKIPEDSKIECERNPAGSYCKMQSIIEEHNIKEHGKFRSKHSKVPKSILPQTPPPQPYAFEEVEVQSSEEALQSDSISMVRSSLGIMTNHCNDQITNRSNSMAFKNSEGPFFSSMTLWGLAMKTLQSESELDQ